PKYAQAHFNLGNALKARGDRDGAVASYRRALEVDPEFAVAHCNLGLLLKELGRFDDAVKHLERGHALGSKRKGWRYRSDLWLADARRLAALDAKLPAALAGKRKPVDAAERLGLAQVCKYKRRYAPAAQLS